MCCCEYLNRLICIFEIDFVKLLLIFLVGSVCFCLLIIFESISVFCNVLICLLILCCVWVRFFNIFCICKLLCESVFNFLVCCIKNWFNFLLWFSLFVIKKFLMLFVMCWLVIFFVFCLEFFKCLVLSIFCNIDNCFCINVWCVVVLFCFVLLKVINCFVLLLSKLL